MASTLVLSGTTLRERLELLLSFYTPSRVYYYGNYTRVTIKNSRVELTQSQIVGEAVNTGLLEVWVEGQPLDVSGASVMVATEEIKKYVKQIPDEAVTLTINDSSIIIKGEAKEITLQVADAEIPTHLLDNHELVKQGVKEPLDIKEINKAIKEVNSATKGVIVTYDNQAIYIENHNVYVNKGVRVTRYKSEAPLGPHTGLYLPLYMVQVLKHLEEENVKCRRLTTPRGEHLVLLEGDNSSIHFQEWYSKDQFPLESIRYLTNITPEKETPMYLEALESLSTATPIIKLDLTNGIISTQDNMIVIEVPIEEQLAPVYISTEVMPKKAELKKFTEVEVTPDLVKFKGDSLITVVATMEVS